MKPLSPYSHAHILSEDNIRIEKYKEQFKERGFDDTELWSLDITISKFIYPRLVRFRETLYGHPCNLSQKKWEEILDKMIEAFGYMSQNETIFDEDKLKIINDGLKLFRKYFRHLWN